MILTNYKMEIDGDQSIMFIALNNDFELQIIASCHLFADGTLVNFHVSESERNKKTGTYLFQHVEKTALKYGLKRISGHVEKVNSAIDFWLKLGFVDYGDHPDYDDCKLIIKDLK